MHYFLIVTVILIFITHVRRFNYNIKRVHL